LFSDKNAGLRWVNYAQKNERCQQVFIKMSKEVGDRVFQVRTESGLSQRDFATQLGISSGGISQIESGKTMPGGDFLLRIHETFGVDLTWLLTGQRSHSAPPPAVPPPTAEEARLLSDFRLCDAQGRAVIRAASRAAATAAREITPSRSRRRTG